MKLKHAGSKIDAEGSAQDAGDASKKRRARVVRRVDINQTDLSLRPLAGADVALFGHTFALDRTEVIDKLALPTPGAYSEICKDQDGELPHAMEMLLRWYFLEKPDGIRIQPIDIFRKIYGDLLASFEGTDSYPTARIMLYTRFAALFGNTVYSAFRWLDINPSTQSYGEASPQIRRLLKVLPKDVGPLRQTLEWLARETWRVRGVDFEAEYPLPDPRSPPLPRRMGPQRGMKAKAVEQRLELVMDTPRDADSKPGKPSKATKVGKGDKLPKKPVPSESSKTKVSQAGKSSKAAGKVARKKNPAKT